MTNFTGAASRGYADDDDEEERTRFRAIERGLGARFRDDKFF